MITIQITGPQGSGKTLAGRAIEKMLLEQGKTVLYATSARERHRLLETPWRNIPLEKQVAVKCDVLIEDFE